MAVSYALSYLESLNPDGVEKGRYFQNQLTKVENLHQILQFVDGNQQIIKEHGEKTYLEELKKVNAKSLVLVVAHNALS